MIKHIQVHLTDMCNLKCKHCYQCGSKNTEVLSIDDFKELIRQYQEVMPENDRQYVHLSITGGEPLILHNFLDYLDIAKEGGIQKLSILTNGSLLTEEILLELKRRDIDIQVSIDGNKEVNDLIRGKGTFDKIMSKIKLASGLGVKLKVSYTLNALNYECVSEAIDQVKDAGARLIWFDRMIPFNDIPKLTTEQFVICLLNIQMKAEEYHSCSEFKVRLRRALQFFAKEDFNICYGCKAGSSVLTVMPNGDVLPCRRLPIPMGNFKENSLKDILNKSKNVSLCKDIHRTPDECLQCIYKDACNGGLKCLTYALHNDFNHGDVNCPSLLLNKLNKEVN